MIPSHYADSCIFLELFSEKRGNKARLCRAYIYDIDKKYKVIISSLTLGEILKFLSGLEGDMERVMAFHKINDIIKNAEVTSPQFEDYKIAQELHNIDYKIEPSDALHVAIAINKKAKVFATLGERELAENGRIVDYCKKRDLTIESL